MSRLILAFKLFFRVLFDAPLAERAGTLLLPAPGKPANSRPENDGPLTPGPSPARLSSPKSARGEGSVAKKEPAKERSSDALVLLAALQREARFVDFVKEPLDAYVDAQVGAAARDVHRQCGEVLERFFALRPLVEAAEASPVELPADFDAQRYRLVGNVTGQTPPRGVLGHHGWQATRVELPQFTGSAQAARIVAPAEVEVR